MAAWKRCEKCRKVLAADAYDDPSETCRACLTTPVRAVRASAVKTVRPAAPPVERAPLRPIVGTGDLEVRERRARRVALDQLSELHAEEYQQLLAAARQVEGLRRV